MAFDSILIANRGEIACRIMRTASALGYRTVAVYSEADCDAPHVTMADDTVLIGAAPAAESYLDIARIVAAAKDAATGAIHPGYGFLSENAAFAQACEQAGIVFIGPSADAIALMGSKAAAKRRMIEAGVPCLPGYQDSDQSDAVLGEAAARIGFPLMVKASAGGGGRGMRFVMSPDELPGALKLARSESLAAFGSDELILERALLRPRHVEVQVFADNHGNTVHLGERDCSIQRRHQKVIEEAPCPVMTAELRERMGAAAVEAAASIGYRGAGTVEFLLGEDHEFFFMEMNTRLQVEHPVTEMITGIDLVALQIRVAQGQPLGLAQEDVVLGGHAIEARLYAEDPAAGFLPGTGRIDWLHFAAGEGIRVDTGVVAGSVISPFYDPMLAKIIAHGADRREAIARLRRALAGTALFGPVSNRDFLIDATGREAFTAGRATTSFVEEEYPQGAFEVSGDGDSIAIAALMQHCTLADEAAATSVSVSPGLRNWSSAGTLTSHYRYAGADGATAVAVHPHVHDGYRVVVADAEYHIDVVERSGDSALLRVDGRPRRVLTFAQDARRMHVATATSSETFVNTLGLAMAMVAGPASGQLAAPMHGVIVELDVAAGDRVARGDRVCVLEAMKMQHELLAATDGTVAAIHFATGDQVPADAVILEIEPPGSEDAKPDKEAGHVLTQASDFRDECEALYQLLAPLGDADFGRPTQFKDWTANDVITHLHVWNQAAHLSLTDEKALLGFLGKVQIALLGGDLRGFESDWLGGVIGIDLKEQWRDFYLAMSREFEVADPKARVKWAGPDMSVRSSITARLMETWAHGQALYDLLGVERVDTDRIRNVAMLGVNTYGWTFKNRRMEIPGPPPRVTLTGPSGDIWEWHKDNTTDRVSGSASEFCQVVTQVRNIDDTQLDVSGDSATAWMAVAQCFAGPPHPPPAAGTRFRLAT